MLLLDRYAHLRSFDSPSFEVEEPKEGLRDLLSKPRNRNSMRTLILMLLQDQLPSVEESVGLKSRMLKGITFPFKEDRLTFQSNSILSEMDMASWNGVLTLISKLETKDLVERKSTFYSSK